MMDQTGSFIQAPRISSQVLYQQSYLHARPPAFDQSDYRISLSKMIFDLKDQHSRSFSLAGVNLQNPGIRHRTKCNIMEEK